MPARSRWALTASAPRSGSGSEECMPRSEPIAVPAAERMTRSCITPPHQIGPVLRRSTPCVWRARDALARAARASDSQSMASSLLIVEDDPEIANALAIFGKARGYATRVANDGPRALEEVARKVPDVILLDVQLPGLD